MDATKRPTKRQKETLNFIQTFIGAHGYGPSYREIMRGLGYKSVATVAAHVDNLITLGLLRKHSQATRSLEVVGSENTVLISRTKVDPADEKWLVTKVDEYFRKAEARTKPNTAQIDELYVLVGALKVLGFEGAYTSFRDRLSLLRKQV